MYAVFLVLHVIACLVLIFVVLLQAGRGGGFSDMMGGGQPQSLFGTQTNAFMLKATEICAVVFLITSLSLGLLASHKNKSLIAKSALTREIQSKIPVIPAAPATTPVQASAPVVAPVSSSPAQAAAEVKAAAESAAPIAAPVEANASQTQ